MWAWLGLLDVAPRNRILTTKSRAVYVSLASREQVVYYVLGSFGQSDRVHIETAVPQPDSGAGLSKPNRCYARASDLLQYL